MVERQNASATVAHMRAALRDQVFHLWSNWMKLAVAQPDKRRAMIKLAVSDAISPASRAAVHKSMAAVGDLLERTRAHGPLRNVPMSFVIGIMNAMADTTMDFMIHDPANAKKHCKVGFDALWRAIA